MSDSNGSTWELRLKKGATFDHETDDMDPHTKGTQIELTFMATDRRRAEHAGRNWTGAPGREWI